jgi:hypothetical protein
MYRVKTAQVCEKNENGTYKTVFNLLHQGEISVAIKECVGSTIATDFVGGYHGDENATALAFYADGELIDTTKKGTYTGITTLEFVQDTIINRCNEPGTPLLAHSQIFLLDTNGLRIDRHIEVLADDFSPRVADGYTMMATVYRIGKDSVRDAENVESTFNIKTMNILNANGELADSTSTFKMEGDSYSWISNDGKEKTTACANDTNKINRYAEYLGDKGVYGRVGFVVNDASMKPQNVYVAVRLTYGDNKWYASVGSYAVEKDGDVVPQGEKWNLSTYYNFDYNTADIAK